MGVCRPVLAEACWNAGPDQRKAAAEKLQSTQRRLNRSSLAVLRILGQHLPGTEEDAAKEDIALKRAAEKGDRHPVAFHQAGEASVVHAAHHRIEPAAEVADQEKAYGAEQS